MGEMRDRDVPVRFRRDLVARGVTDAELAKGRAAGAVVQVRRGAYVDGGAYRGMYPEERHRLEVIAAAQQMRGAVVSHQSAAVLHGLDLWAIPLTRVHVTRDAASGGKCRAETHVHAGRLDDGEVDVVEGIRVTSLARTVADVLRTVPFEQGVVVGDSALRNGLSPKAATRWLKSGGWGVAKARAAAEFLDSRSESVGESRSRVLMADHGIPTPDLQRELRSANGEFLARVDFLFEKAGVIGEFDGLAKYRQAAAGDPGRAVAAEKAREDRLRDEGWTVVRWVWSELDTPHVVAARIRRALTRGNRR